MKQYDFRKIEPKWQKKWLKDKLYEPNLKSAKRPFYNLMMFPYPSAEGLHVGNMYAFTGADIYGRFKRMQGYDVFEPIGLDGFGIHSENYALKIGTHPMDQSKISEKRFYEQLQAIGNGFAWEERLETYAPEYYKWTQWIFVQLFKRGLAYRKKQAVNWCPKDKTVLADEQVVSGKCERCGSVVEKKQLEQWFFRITKYADRLLANLEKIDWSEKVKIAQRNWIGKSEGAEIDFVLNLPKFSGDVVFATNNAGKVKRMQKLFAAAGLEVALKTPEEAGIKYTDVLEDGRTIQENAEKKARELAKKTSLPVFADDSGFFINGAEIDPVAVKRNALHGIDEKSLSVEEIAKRMQDYYKNIASSYGGRVEAEWRNALCLIRPDKNAVCVETVRPVILTDESRGKVDPYLPLRGLYISKATNKYVLEQTEAEEIKELQPIIDGVREIFIPKIRVFTTRPDTLFGATYMVLSPEHPLVQNLKSEIKNWVEVKKYIEVARKKSEEERVVEGKEKTGVELRGVKAINPANKKEIPIFVADYVLSSYGTGAIMAVPAHDERDFEFAKKLNLPIEMVICPNYPAPVCPVLDKAYEAEGYLVGSGKFDGMPAEKAKWEITKFVGGERKIQYRLRDWLISRQRYWGVPIPMIHCEKCGWQPVAEKDLPVLLPHIKDFRPKGKGESPLATDKSFYEIKCPKCEGYARRETDVSDTFFDSAWYYLRYPSVHDNKEIFDPKITKKWLPVNLYTGGAEHSVLHLLYVRFMAMVLHEMGLLDFEEPFPKFRAHGLLISEGAKMSKSKGNVVNPDAYIKEFGADTLRMYLMFLAPFEQGGDFRDEAILGISRFLEWVWKYFSERPPHWKSKDRNKHKQVIQKTLNIVVKKVTEDIEKLSYNTAISQLMIMRNVLQGCVIAALPENREYLEDDEAEVFLKLLAPFAPYITEEFWHNLGNKNSVHKEKWPEYDLKLIQSETISLVVQINGKHRATINAAAGISQDEAEKLAKTDEKVGMLLAGQKIQKVIFVPNRLINFVLK